MIFCSSQQFLVYTDGCTNLAHYLQNIYFLNNLFGKKTTIKLKVTDILGQLGKTL